VSLWTRRTDHAEQMRRDGRNGRYLTDAALGDVRPTAEAEEALDGAELVVMAIPSHALRASVAGWGESFEGRCPAARVLIAAKGVEIDTLAPMADVVADVLPVAKGRIAALGGPSFAAEVAVGQPTAVVVGCESERVAEWIQRVMAGEAFRVYTTTDVVGVELGGALKNVIALAAGMTDGAGLGLNARAALITRGLAEIARLAIARGADPLTLSGLAGLGDLVLTCTGGLSRNRRVGVALGEGRTLDDILDEMGMVAEGVKNTKSAWLMAQQERVDMPITATVHEILYEGLSVREAVGILMGRALKSERA
jgi:glycerol-3-phosphate dehydrogenase (NAD(P)+)